MKRLKRLKLLHQLAHLKTEHAGKLLAEAQVKLTKEQQRMQALESYKTEYHNYLQNQQQSYMNSQQLLTYQQFLHHLTGVTDQQQNTISAILEEVTKRQTLWAKCHSREKVVGDLVERLQKDIIHEAEIKQQREEDLQVLDIFNTVKINNRSR